MSEFKRELFEDTIKRKCFVIPSFEIYGGYSGLYDLGPAAAALKSNIIDLWRKQFVVHDDLLEVDAVSLTPEPVLKASGHVDKFTDLITHDTVTGWITRADTYLESVMDQRIAETEDEALQAEYRHVAATCDGLGPEPMAELFKKYDIRSPDGNPMSDPVPYNLMFKTQLGPSGKEPAYLRPETAQGMFVNFRRMLDYAHNTLPFGVAQIGRAFRNEISPRGGLLRMREFNQAEIEFFMNSREDPHPRFHLVRDKLVRLFPSKQQLADEDMLVMSFGDAVKEKFFEHETIAYWIGRAQNFLESVGIPFDHIRFRQHLPTQLAHYARDCWDAEVLSRSTGAWFEVIGIADRACFDLDCHSKATGQPMTVYRRFSEPREEKFSKCLPNKRAIGTTFRGNAGAVNKYIESLDTAENVAAFVEHTKKGEPISIEGIGDVTITPDMYTVSEGTRMVHGENFIPCVCEPSFGIDRIMHYTMEHAFYVRPDDEQRCVFSFPPQIAPIKVAILPLVSNAKFDPIIEHLTLALRSAGIRCATDCTGTAIGRRYSRFDELGTAFGITVDFDTVEHDTVSLRERDSMIQTRIPCTRVPEIIGAMCHGTRKWSEVLAEYGEWKSKSDETETTKE